MYFSDDTMEVLEHLILQLILLILQDLFINIADIVITKRSLERDGLNLMLLMANLAKTK